MKKLILLALALMLCASALAEVDLSGMTVEELADLRDRAQRAIWDSDDWQEVTVPEGVWRVGEDIPLGHWTVTAGENARYGGIHIIYCEVLDETGKNAKVPGGFYHGETVALEGGDLEGYNTTYDLDLQYEGYLIIQYGSAIFTPYAGHPDLGFKKP